MSPNSWFSQPVYIPGGDPEAMNEPSLAYPGQLGIRFAYTIPPRSAPNATTSNGTAKGYQIVKTDSTMSVAPYDGATAWFQDRAAYVVTTSPTALGQGRVAGVFRNAVTPGNFTCVQIKGIHDKVKVTDASPLGTGAGEFVVPSGTAGKALVIAAGSPATYPALGRLVGTVNAVTRECAVDLDVPDVY